MYYGTYQFPNLMLNLHPDAAMYYLALPRGPGHTTVISEYLFRPETIAAPDFRAGAGRRAVGPHLEAGLGGLRACPDRGLVALPTGPGVYPRKDRFLFDFNERYRAEMGRPQLG